MPTAFLVLAILASDPNPAAPPKPLVVLELFTSQGCSSCPPADALLSELAASPDVIALSFHVDYWDDLGWKDPWSSPAWTARQRAYAKHGDGRVYTPQLVVNGANGFVGSSRTNAERAIAAARKRSMAATVGIEVAGAADVTVQVTPIAATGETLRVEVLLVDDAHVTVVRDGENAGRTLRNVGVVRALLPAGEIPARSSERWSATLTIPTAGARAVVLVRDASGAVVAAAATPLSRKN